ncbi:hypothetical protein M1373_01705 [Candidatus Marsarchaeota archaeon]|nr:hypothetical protein [Candidatus Marsarchaeota archaeon]MCL5404418.1 hypothetical protein [Candidatus Marsarchaeota archaeon]
MKAQAALIEAMISIAILGAAASFMYAASLYSGMQVHGVHRDAAYAFSLFASRNASLGKCISSGNFSAECEYIAAAFVKAYDIQSMQVSYNGRHSDFGSSTVCPSNYVYCAVVAYNLTPSYACVSVCG